MNSPARNKKGSKRKKLVSESDQPDVSKPATSTAPLEESTFSFGESKTVDVAYISSVDGNVYHTPDTKRWRNSKEPPRNGRDGLNPRAEAERRIPKPKRKTMSAAARRKMAAAQRARWAKVKAARKAGK